MISITSDTIPKRNLFRKELLSYFLWGISPQEFSGKVCAMIDAIKLNEYLKLNETVIGEPAF